MIFYYTMFLPILQEVSQNFSVIICDYREFISFFSFGQKKTKVEIKHTDVMKGDREIRRLQGNVVFKHDDAYMYCDSAISYAKDNRFEAYGHVRIVNKEVTVYGDTLFYSSSSSMASLRGDIRMIHEKMTLTTHFLDYDLKKNMGFYRNGFYQEFLLFRPPHAGGKTEY